MPEAQLDKKSKKTVLDHILKSDVWAYSPVQRALLKYLFSQEERSSERDIAANVFATREFDQNASNVIRFSAHNLRERLQRFFVGTPEGRTSPYLVYIEASGGKGYRLTFTLNPAAQPLLKIFLCHSSGDKKAVRRLHKKLGRDGFLPWLDREDLLPGADWEAEIEKAVKQSDIVLVCLSPSSITKEGFVQKEIRMALDVADEKPEGTIFIIPVLLKPCTVPDRLRKWHWIDLYKPNGYKKLVAALRTIKRTNVNVCGQTRSHHRRSQ